MSVNVRCAGGGEWYAVAAQTPAGERRLRPPVRLTAPCGWEDYRTGYVTGYNLAKQQWKCGPPTLLPCPRCDGKVELIPEAGGPDRR